MATYERERCVTRFAKMRRPSLQGKSKVHNPEIAPSTGVAKAGRTRLQTRAAGIGIGEHKKFRRRGRRRGGGIKSYCIEYSGV
jgi:hypothetical protein